MKSATAYLSFLTAVAVLFSAVSTVADNSKITPRLNTSIGSASENETHLCWVHINSAGWQYRTDHLSDRALARRAKADPQRYLIDSSDYSIGPLVLSDIEATGAQVRHVSRWLRAVSIKADAATIDRVASLSSVSQIDILQILRFFRPEEKLSTPASLAAEFADSLYGESLLQNRFTKANKLHAAGLSGKGVRIAILDSGFDLSNPAFDSINVVDSYDFINGVVPVDQFDCPTQSNSFRQNYHGTLVASTIAAYAPGELIGGAYNAEYMLAKTEITCDGAEIKVEEDNWVAAAEWAEAGGADIITSSLGYFYFNDAADYQFSDLDGETATITIAADLAASKNVLVITSAGNERGSTWNHITVPADGDLVVAVGALLNDSSLASFSSPGPTADGRVKPDCVSLGVTVKAAFDLGGYIFVSGTSFAAPLVASACALAFEHDPTLTALELRRSILETSNRSQNPDFDFGYGVFDGARAAEIIRIDSLDRARLLIGESRDFGLITSGRTDSIPKLAAFNLPPGSSLTDSGNGRGSLHLVASKETPQSFKIGLVADIGTFSDTTFMEIETYSSLNSLVTFGPNPFENFVNFIIRAKSSSLVTVTVFNSSGEKIVELVDQSHTSADDSIKVITWDGHNASGRKAAAGVYLAYIQAGNDYARVKLLKTD